MLGNTLTLNIGTDADPVEIILSKVNQDGYSSEYRLKESDREHVVIIRHSTEKTRVKGKVVDRHQVSYQQNLFPTELSPQGETRQVYTILRVAPELDPTDAANMTAAVSRFAMGNAPAIANWES